jgi:hypothetical protein
MSKSVGYLAPFYGFSPSTSMDLGWSELWTNPFQTNRAGKSKRLAIEEY